jgi:putative membrane protein
MLEFTTLTAAVGTWHEGGGWHHGHWWIWTLLWGLVLALALAAFWRSRRAPRAGDSAKTILAERYAKGEITPEEYRERLATLGEQR